MIGCAKMKLSVVLAFATLSLGVLADNKIVGGQIAEPHSFPFQVALLVRRENKDTTFCGGSVIKENAVLTAAHCLMYGDRALLIFGAHDVTLIENGTVRQLVNKTSFRIHPEFNLQLARLDIALILLDTPIEYTDNIQAVKLPSRFLFDEPFSGEIGTVSGFGQYCDDCGSSHVLRFTQNRVMSNDDCSKQFNFNAIPSDTQICLTTADTKSGNCRGDSGGPLTIKRADRLNKNEKNILQIGISSFGRRKCEQGHPTVFTRLTRELVAWINEETEGNKKKA